MEVPLRREKEQEQKSRASAHRHPGGGSGYHMLGVSGRPEQSSQRRTAPVWQVSIARADVRSISIPINPQARSGNNTPILALGSQHRFQGSWLESNPPNPVCPNSIYPVTRLLTK